MKRTALLLALLLSATGTAFAQDETIELKFSSWVPPSHAMHDAIRAWGASIAEASNDTLSVTLYPSQQLGKANDHYDMARDGIAEITYISMGYQAGRLPIAEAGNLPFLMSNADGGSRAYDEWYRPYSKTEMADVKFCLAFVHDPGALHSKKEIRTPDQLEGLKIRSAHSTMAAFVNSLGGVNVRVSAPESRTALESGVADAITFPWESIRLFGIDNVVTHSMDLNLYVSSFAWLINKAVYEGMSDAQKTVIDAHCNSDWAARVGKVWGDYEAAGRDALRNKDGHTVYKLTPEEIAAWRKAAEPIRAQWAKAAKDAGLNEPMKALADLEGLLKKYDAAFE